MTLAGDLQTRFSELEQLEIAEYRPFNRFALIAFVLSWFSALALTHPVFWILPLSSAIFAAIALWQLGIAENKQSGRGLAVAGLSIALLFGSWSLVRETTREMRLFAQGRTFAESWFELIRQGKIHEAHQLTLGDESRVAAGVSLADYYAKKTDAEKRALDDGHGSSELGGMALDPNTELDQFFAQHAPKHVRDLGSKGRYVFRRNGQITRPIANADEVNLVFDVHDETGGPQGVFTLTISLLRTRKSGLAADWRVARITDDHSS